MYFIMVKVHNPPGRRNRRPRDAGSLIANRKPQIHAEEWK